MLGPLGFVSLEAGWLVTEWGRQPWIVRGLMRTADAVTDFPYKAAPFWLFTIVYLFLGVAVVYLLARQIAARRQSPTKRRGPRMAPELLARGRDRRRRSCLYFLFGGADFGGGVWDLLARGPRAAAQRAPSRPRSARSGRRTTSG